MRRAELLAFLSSLPARKRDQAIEERLGIAQHVSSAPPGEHLIGYHASGVSAIVRALIEVPVTSEDVLIDLGSGVGKVVLLARILSGAQCRGIEIQAELAERAQRAARQLELDAAFVNADARDAELDDGTVFFLYSPFSGPVLGQVMGRLHGVAKRHAIVVCALGVELARKAPWLAPRPTDSFWLTLYDSVLPGVAPRSAPEVTPEAAARAIAHELG